MDRITLELAVVHPGETSYYATGGANVRKRAVGVHVAVARNGGPLIEGQVDPDRLDQIVADIESATLLMPHEHFRRADGGHPGVDREGWGLRWLERAIRELREAVSADLSKAVDKLAARRDELERYK